MLTTYYNAFDIVKVPFPFTDQKAAKIRPALILSSATYAKNTQHYVLCMITTAKHSHWANDVDIQDWKGSGLPVASIIRWKLFSLDQRLIMGGIGVLNEETKDHVRQIYDDIFIDLKPPFQC